MLRVRPIIDSAENTTDVGGVIAEPGAGRALIALLLVAAAAVRVRPAQVTSESVASPADVAERTAGTAPGRVAHVDSVIVVKSLLVAPMRLACESVPASVSIV
jgi:hypothetical protein